MVPITQLYMIILVFNSSILWAYSKKSNTFYFPPGTALALRI